MNDKIKEILDFKEDADYKRLSVDEITMLRDYIINLEQCYCNRTDCIGRIKDSKKYDSLQQRIDKAIEYVNTHKPSDTISFPLMKKDEENQVKSCFDYEFREIYQKELLDILQGSDKE